MASPPTSAAASSAAPGTGPPPRRPGGARRRPRILLAVTGSVAAIKSPELAVRLVTDADADVRILLTRGGENFWKKAGGYDEHHWNTLHGLLDPSQASNEEAEGQPRISIYDADAEWKEWQTLGDPVLHIELRDWADILLIAPLSAHTLAKISHGLCDDTLSCVVRAWDFGHGTRPGKPLLLAPAMNTAMWQHPLTQEQLSTVQGLWSGPKPAPSAAASCGDTDEEDGRSNGVHIIAPQVKSLACGEIGVGALASLDEILQVVRSFGMALSLEATGRNYR